MKLASLFDGISGFPLAGLKHGIEPVWASEIERVPVEISKRHFPNMKHYGDVTKINGAEVEPVDIVTFGSPCQDLSVAGKRAGMGEGTRSGLFSEAVRIIKEMRDASRIRLERRPDPEVGAGSCPGHEKPEGGLCGNLRNNNDVGSERGEGNNAAIESGNARHELHSNNGGENARGTICPRYAVWENVPGAFSSNRGEDFRAVIESLAKVIEETVSIPLPKDGRWEPAGLVEGDGWSIAWRTLDAQFWGVPQRRKRIFLVADFGGDRASEIFLEPEGLRGDPPPRGDERKGPSADVAGGVEGGVGEAICFEPRSQDGEPRINGNVSPPLNTAQGGQRQPCVCIHATQDPITAEDRTHALGVNSSQAVMYDASGSQGATLTANNGDSVNNQTPSALLPTATVRRLTPTECERLQGFYDGWTEGHSDSARYKALGNSVAIPCVEFILGTITREV